MSDVKSELRLSPSNLSTIIPIKNLAFFTAITCAASLVLSGISGADNASHEAATATIFGQNIWNAAQVGFLLILLCLWQSNRTWQFRVFAGVSLLSLPFAIYITSPGALVCAALLLAACLLARKAPDLAVDFKCAPGRGVSIVAKFAFLAFLCNLGSSMYNFYASQNVWPYWFSIFDTIADLIGFTSDFPTVANAMYTLGIDGISLPPYINLPNPENDLGSFVFAHIWTVLPALYTLYFLAMMQLAKDSPGTRLQQVLCMYCIFHFLFLTDFVDYFYGRGFINPAAHWIHWNERLVWRIAILLPIYQKLATNMWKHGNGPVGVVLHYVLLFWAIGFFVQSVLFRFGFSLYNYVTGQEFNVFSFIGFRINQLDYYDALVFMLFVYGFTALSLRCKRFHVSILRV